MSRVIATFLFTGYLKPDAGRIELEGDDITALGHVQIARRGICRVRSS